VDNIEIFKNNLQKKVIESFIGVGLGQTGRQGSTI